MIQVGIIMGSKSDLPVMQSAIDILDEFNIKIEVDIVSAHRTPKKMFEYAENAKKRGIKVIIAGLVVQLIFLDGCLDYNYSCYWCTGKIK
jgi:5-(carboxyamino)imidazole ribonucleotide mutase